jgi:hypothetical protein
LSEFGEVINKPSLEISLARSLSPFSYLIRTHFPNTSKTTQHTQKDLPKLITQRVALATTATQNRSYLYQSRNAYWRRTEKAIEYKNNIHEQWEKEREVGIDEDSSGTFAESHLSHIRLKWSSSLLFLSHIDRECMIKGMLLGAFVAWDPLRQIVMRFLWHSRGERERFKNTFLAHGVYEHVSVWVTALSSSEFEIGTTKRERKI